MSGWLREGEDVQRVGYQFAMAPPPGVSAEEDVVRRIRAEIMPNFVPLWLTRTFRYPTGKEFTIVHVVLARYELHPPQGARIVAGLPLGPNGEKIKVIDIANGLTQSECTQGFIGRYQPLAEVFEAMREGMAAFKAQSDIESFEIEEAKDERERKAMKEEKKRKLIEHLADVKRDNRGWLNKQHGHSDSVFVSSTLRKIQKLVGRLKFNVRTPESPKSPATMPRGGEIRSPKTA